MSQDLMTVLHSYDWHSQTKSAEMEWGQRLEVCMSEGVSQVRYGGTAGGLYNKNRELHHNDVTTTGRLIKGCACAMFCG